LTPSLTGYVFKPATLAVSLGPDSTGDDFVAFPSGTRAAITVLGKQPSQPVSTRHGGRPGAGESAFEHNEQNQASLAGLSGPQGFAVAADGKFYVADTGNNRVLGWLSAAAAYTGQPAALVIGQ